MTNIESFNKALIIGDDDIATIVLNSKGITGTDSDENDVSFAWGLVYSCTSPDYTQGKTSEKFSKEAMLQKLRMAKEILEANDILYQPFSEVQIIGGNW